MKPVPAGLPAFLLWFYCFSSNFSYSYASRSLKIAPPDGGRVTESLPFSTGMEGASPSKKVYGLGRRERDRYGKGCGLAVIVDCRKDHCIFSQPAKRILAVGQKKLFIRSVMELRIIPVDPGQGGDMVRDGAGLLFHIL